MDENVIFMDFFAVKVDKVTSTQESVYMKTSLQIPGLTSFPSTLTAKRPWRWHFRPTRYITIFLNRIQRLQIFKIPIEVIGTFIILCFVLATNICSSISLKYFRLVPCCIFPLDDTIRKRFCQVPKPTFLYPVCEVKVQVKCRFISTYLFVLLRCKFGNCEYCKRI